jgi:Helix-turn-helix of DDE superfamily endonuclease
MLNIERILAQDCLMRAMTGLNLKSFEELLLSFTEAYEESILKLAKKRKCAHGGGRKSVLSTVSVKLVFILVYCKYYPTFDVLGAMFGFDRSCAHDWVHRLLPVLGAALGYQQALPLRQLKSMEEFLEKFSDIEKVIFDGTERPVQRPKDSDRQKKHYSGKKKDIPIKISLEVLVKNE